MIRKLETERVRGAVYAGIDYREEFPRVCYQTPEMKEPQVLPLEFGGQGSRAACFRKALSALKHYGRKEEIFAAVVLPKLSKEGMRQYQKDAYEAGFLEGQLLLMSGPESIVHFVMHQTNDIWQQQVWFLEFESEEVKATCMEVNKRTAPMLVKVKEPERWYVGTLLDGMRDERLLQEVEKRFERQKVSAVFLAGTDLNSRDYKKSREAVCRRRRVFLVDQLYARGACALAGDENAKRPYLFLNEQTLLYNVGIRSVAAGAESVHTILSAGCNWYEAKASCEVLLCTESLLEFSFLSMLGGEPIREGMFLTGLPKRPKGTSRLLLEVQFSSPARCEVKVTDLGFGEMYPSSDLYWRETFVLEEQEGEDGTGSGL